MASDPRIARGIFALMVLGASACAHGDPRRFALRGPVWRDQDLDVVKVKCDPSKKPEDCAPHEYESSFAWDAADNTLFRGPSELFAVKRNGEAKNVNAFDEVPDSSWFVNRIGGHPMTAQEVFDGYCKPGATLESDQPEKKWLIDHGKDNGANPGFRVLVDGVKYMLKTDEGQGERATAATAIASRFYFAAGWWAPCDAIVYFKRSQLNLKPGLTIKNNTGPPKKFDEKLLDSMLEKTARRGDSMRAAASRWLPGKPLGPFTYDGLREDDPSDVIPHEHRRDLRGARVMAAWLNHFDSREQNTMSTWQAEKDGEPGRGSVRHWYIDLGDCFGSEWYVDGFSRRHGQAYLLDFRYLVQDFASFGAVTRPWDRAQKSKEGDIFGYFSARDFDPDEWKGEYANPAFQNLEERDGAWAARIIARFTREHIEAAVNAGNLTSPVHRTFLIDTLVDRQRIILHRYFRHVSPLTDVVAENGTLCATDLARQTSTFADASFRYAATITRGGRHEDDVNAGVAVAPAGKVCISLTARAPDSGEDDDAPSRYVVVRLANGATPGPLLVHLYDLGPKRGLRIVGLERPD